MNSGDDAFLAPLAKNVVIGGDYGIPVRPCIPTRQAAVLLPLFPRFDLVSPLARVQQN